MFDEATQKEFLAEFVTENRNALDEIEQDLLRLETAPGDRGLLNTVFRNMHTVKGNCRLMAFERLEGLTHKAEDLLDLMRDGRIKGEQRIFDAMLGVIDSVRNAMDDIEGAGAEGDYDFTRHYQTLDDFLALSDLDPVLEADDDAESQGVELSLGDPEPNGAPEGGGDGHGSRLHSITLTIDRLDHLMDMVGEMGASFNQLRYSITRNPEQVSLALEGLERHIHQIQDEVLQYRLQPIGRIWDSYHRLVRDLAVSTKKKVILELVGEETEVDRNILLSIKESLGHLIRNAIDHGIESKKKRKAAEKSPVGRVTMSAEQKHGQIYLEVTDDGRGIDVEKVRAKAVIRGMMTDQEARDAPEGEILKLVMAPGFSTAEEVSRVSGRGTGMDVVKTAVEKVGGTIQIDSEPGRGTTFRLRIPQTVSIVPTLLVQAAGESYAIPQLNVVELVSYFGNEVGLNVEGKMQSPMVKVRDHLLPMLQLDRILTLGNNAASDRELREIRAKKELHIAVLQIEETKFGLEVDAIDDPVNLVIKPLPRALSLIDVLAGTAVMPDGSVTFLLSILELRRFLETA